MEIPASKRRRIRVPLPKVNTFVWDSPFNMEGKIAISNEELGDGATSRVYVGTIEDQKLAVKRLKGFSPNHTRILIDTYRIRQNIRGGKLLRFINNMHYVGKPSRFADLSSARTSAMWILECAQIRIN